MEVDHDGDLGHEVEPPAADVGESIGAEIFEREQPRGSATVSTRFWKVGTLLEYETQVSVAARIVLVGRVQVER